MTEQTVGSLDGNILGINSGMGEGFGLYRIGDDRALMPLIDAANVACGSHAGDPMTMRETVRLAKEFGVGAGAHPSLPDLQGFGRREMRLGPEELAAAIVYQVGALRAFLEAEGMRLTHVKPHGALYAMAAREEAVANAVADGALPFDIPIYGLPKTLHEEVYTARGLEFVAEFYVDLEYDPKGHIIITRSHEAIDPEYAANRALRAATDGIVRAVDGTDVAVRPQSFCIHSDTPNAADLAAAVSRKLAAIRARNAAPLRVHS